MKRSRDAIISIILDVCVNGASKTKIVYQANLNFRTVIPYMDMMLKNGLIEPTPESNKVYKTTPKGIKVLNEFKIIQDMLPELYNIQDVEK